jgi:glycerol kinase
VPSIRERRARASWCSIVLGAKWHAISEHRQILPQAGWVEHDPLEIAARVDEVIAGALWRSNLTGSDLAAIGITNQRETVVVWNPKTGRPWYNAIVWQDTRMTAAYTSRTSPTRAARC